MGWFKKRAESREQIEELQARIAAMADRLEQADVAKRDLGNKVDAVQRDLGGKVDAVQRDLAVKVDGIVTRLDEADEVDDSVENETFAPPATPPVGPIEFDLLSDRIGQMADRLDQVDQRITSISTELANQISELSGDLEAVGGNEPATDEVVDELRDAQSRLANEQARYQIAFRQDLADLADRLRRG